MEYRVLIGSGKYTLPKYNLEIAEKLEEIELLNRGNQKFRDKCEKMYEFVSEMIGEDNAIKELGEIRDIDPNELNIAYLDIVKTYSDPLTEHSMKQIEKAFDNKAVKSAMKVIEQAPKIEQLNAR